jgi:predicted glycosyltransferase
MAENGRIFIWVQHLHGSGRFRGVAHLARYLATRGWEVDLVSGGAPVRGIDLNGVRLHQLPPVRAADGSLTRIVYIDGKPIDASVRTIRRDLLLRLFAGADPHILMLEQFPFALGEFGFELEPVLAAALKRANRPSIVASVRDILPVRTPEREAGCVAVLQAFDAVMVHGDPRLIGLEESFGRVPAIANQLVYTGYVGGLAPMAKVKAGVGSNEVIVSAGGGTFGPNLASVAVEAARLMQYVRRWRILLDAEAGPRAFRKLRARAPQWVEIEPARPDYRTLLSRCALSISQAGYNTVVDVLSAGARAVFVPYARDGITEQTLRAELLERRGMARVLPEEQLSPGRLVQAVTDMIEGPPSIRKIKIDGEATTERVLGDMLAERREKARA